MYFNGLDKKNFYVAEPQVINGLLLKQACIESLLMQSINVTQKINFLNQNTIIINKIGNEVKYLESRIVLRMHYY